MGIETQPEIDNSTEREEYNAKKNDLLARDYEIREETYTGDLDKLDESFKSKLQPGEKIEATLRTFAGFEGGDNDIYDVLIVKEPFAK